MLLMYRLVTFLFALLLISIIRVNGANWDYGKHGPDIWKETFPACAGKKQSPINIRTKCTVHQVFNRFEFTPGHYNQIKFQLTNNGHTITAEPDPSTNILLSGGKLQGSYRFQSFHIHWGPNHDTGSEHQL